MKIDLKREIDDLVIKDWKFLEENSDILIFQKLSWNLSWLNEKDRYKNISIITVSKDEKPLIIFPFCIIKRLNFRILRWVGYDISDYLGPLVNKEYEIDKKVFDKIWKEVLKLVRNECDLIFLDKQVNESFFSNNLMTKNLKCKKYQQTYRTDLLRWQEIEKIKNRSLQKFRWAKKKLSNMGELKFIEKVNDFNEKKKLIKKAIDWKKEKKNKSGFLRSFSEKFYSNILDDKSIVISGLKLDNHFIAISLGFVQGLNYFYLVPSYKIDHNFIKYSPGKILMIELLNYFQNKNFKYFDFCDGQESYKENWTNNKIDINLYIKPTNLLGLILSFFFKIKKL